ncbi:MAG: hypothetical protein IMZ43_03170 [Thermoplasmata archaeon]|nr:hypothetical protein [Thermoplasmata archaeon]
MNKKIYSMLILFLLCSTVVAATGTELKSGKQPTLQPPIEWTKTYGSSKIDLGHCIQKTSDGGYIITGAYNRNAFMPWRGDIYLLKTDEFGTEQWHQNHGIEYNENVGRSVQQTSDGGYIIAGYTGYTYHIEGYVEKTDAEGNIVWSSLFGKFDYYDNLQSASQTTDGGYIAVGWVGSYGAGSSDVWLIKMNAEGVEEWNHTYGGTGLDGGNSVQQTADGGFIITGVVESSLGNSDLWLLKTDTNGNEEWNKTFGGSEYEEGGSVQQTSDGGYIITGSTTSFGAGDADVWLIKTDDYGNEEWNYFFGGTAYDVGNSVQQTTDGGYFITGEYTNTSSQIPDVYLIKTDDTGNEEWNQIIDNDGKEDVANYGIETTDCGYIVVGNTGVYQQEAVDIWVLKFEGTNSEPYEPNNPSPANNSSDVSIDSDLSWSGGDPDNDSVTYDLYFGTSPTPPLLAENILEASYDPGTLLYETTYYWKIRAIDSNGASTEGPVWTFTTKNEIPVMEITSITGKLGVSAVIQNKGNADASTITWSMLITGGIFKLIQKTITGEVSTLGVGNETTITSGIFVGFGKINIVVSVTCDEVEIPVEKDANGTIFLVWVKINS